MLAQGTSATALEKSVITTFNQKLVAKAAAFASANSGASTYTYDSNAKVTKILDSPTSYGLVDATSYGDVVNDAWCKFCRMLTRRWRRWLIDAPLNLIRTGNNYHISPPVHTLLAADIQSILKTAGILTA